MEGKQRKIEKKQQQVEGAPNPLVQVLIKSFDHLDDVSKIFTIPLFQVGAGSAGGRGGDAREDTRVQDAIHEWQCQNLLRERAKRVAPCLVRQGSTVSGSPETSDETQPAHTLLTRDYALDGQIWEIFGADETVKGEMDLDQVISGLMPLKFLSRRQPKKRTDLFEEGQLDIVLLYVVPKHVPVVVRDPFGRGVLQTLLETPMMTIGQLFDTEKFNYYPATDSLRLIEPTATLIEALRMQNVRINTSKMGGANQKDTSRSDCRVGKEGDEQNQHPTPLTLFVKSYITGMQHRIVYHCQDTVWELMEFICRVEGTPVMYQQLIWAGMLLSHRDNLDRRLSLFNLRRDSTLHLVTNWKPDGRHVKLYSVKTGSTVNVDLRSILAEKGKDESRTVEKIKALVEQQEGAPAKSQRLFSGQATTSAPPGCSSDREDGNPDEKEEYGEKQQFTADFCVTGSRAPTLFLIQRPTESVQLKIEGSVVIPTSTRDAESGCSPEAGGSSGGGDDKQKLPAAATTTFELTLQDVSPASTVAALKQRLQMELRETMQLFIPAPMMTTGNHEGETGGAVAGAGDRQGATSSQLNPTALVENQRLSFLGAKLHDHQVLSDCGIGSGTAAAGAASPLLLELRIRQPRRVQIVLARSAAGGYGSEDSPIRGLIDADDTVDDIKRVIEEFLGVAIEDQRLLADGVHLVNGDRTLQECCQLVTTTKNPTATTATAAVGNKQEEQEQEDPVKSTSSRVTTPFLPTATLQLVTPMRGGMFAQIAGRNGGYQITAPPK